MRARAAHQERKEAGGLRAARRLPQLHGREREYFSRIFFYGGANDVNFTGELNSVCSYAYGPAIYSTFYKKIANFARPRLSSHVQDESCSCSWVLSLLSRTEISTGCVVPIKIKPTHFCCFCRTRCSSPDSVAAVTPWVTSPVSGSRWSRWPVSRCWPSTRTRRRSRGPKNVPEDGPRPRSLFLKLVTASRREGVTRIHECEHVVPCFPWRYGGFLVGEG